MAAATSEKNGEKCSKRSLGPLNNILKSSRVLLVGAGGIGCELLKNLVLTGFGQVHIVDLDTIDLSNLNRQFLFRHEHIKRPKALVAKESAAAFNPNVNIEAQHANIKDPQFSIDFYKGFNIVFNALDNLEARRHVNRMCLAADVPLIESGTTGFLGQVQVIKKAKSQCYDCTPKETPKTFPVCTIRSTPSQPIHCIVWAKSYLFAELFGTSEDDMPELDNTQTSDNAAEIAKLQSEAQALKLIKDSMGAQDFPKKVFEKVFKDDIERLRSMEDMWKNRLKPEPLDFDKLTQESQAVGPLIAEQDQSVWTVPESFAVFLSSLKKLSDRLQSDKTNSVAGEAAPVLSFDKDDKDTLDFVASTANLRSTIFGIESKSEFDIKQMAGNIIPAIATTNAKVAGLCVLQAFKVLRNDYDKTRHISLFPSYDRVFAANPLLPPNPECSICGVALSPIEVDLTRATLHDLVDGILKSELGYGDEFSISTDAGIIFDPELDENLTKKMTELDIKQDSFLTVVDENDDEPRVNLVLAVVDKSRSEDQKPLALTETLVIPKKVKSEPEPEDDGEAVEILSNGAGLKRKRSIDQVSSEMDALPKRTRVVGELPVQIKPDDRKLQTDSSTLISNESNNKLSNGEADADHVGNGVPPSNNNE